MRRKACRESLRMVRPVTQPYELSTDVESEHAQVMGHRKATKADLPPLLQAWTLKRRDGEIPATKRHLRSEHLQIGQTFETNNSTRARQHLWSETFATPSAQPNPPYFWCRSPVTQVCPKHRSPVSFCLSSLALGVPKVLQANRQ